MTSTQRPAVARSAHAAPLPLLYTPRWRWPVRPLADAPLHRPLDILGVLPPRDSHGPFTEDGLPEPLSGLSPAATLAALAVADGLLPSDLRLSGPVQPPPLRVALFGPVAAAVLDIVRSIFGPPPPGRIFSAHAVRGRCDPEEPALPPGVWPLLCAPQRPLEVRDGLPGPPLLGNARGALAGLLAPLHGIPGRDYSSSRALCCSTADTSAGSPLLSASARAMSGALPFLHDRLYLILMALHAAIHGEPVNDPFSPLAGEVNASALDLAGAAFGDLVSFYARVRPPPATPALRLAAAILRDRPSTVARTTCGVAGVTDDHLRQLEGAAWLEHPDPLDDWRRLSLGSVLPLPLPRPQGGRWYISEVVAALPPAALVGKLRRRPEAVAIRVKTA